MCSAYLYVQIYHEILIIFNLFLVLFLLNSILERYILTILNIESEGRCMRKFKILVVDDEPGIRLCIRTLLSAEYNVYCVGSGTEAIEFVLYNKPDLVLLDIILPDMNGIDILNRIKEINSDIPVIMVSVINNIRTIVKSLKSGAYDFFQKPFDIDIFKKTVHENLINSKKTGNIHDIDLFVNEITGAVLKENISFKNAVQLYQQRYVHSVIKKSNGIKIALSILNIQEKELSQIYK